MRSIRWSKMPRRSRIYIIFSEGTRRYIFRLDHTCWKNILSAAVAVAARNCSRLLTLHPCCISAQTLIRTNGTRVHALRNTERGILCEDAREQRPERDPSTDTFLFLFGHTVSLETNRATCFHFARVGRVSVLFPLF